MFESDPIKSSSSSGQNMKVKNSKRLEYPPFRTNFPSRLQL